VSGSWLASASAVASRFSSLAPAAVIAVGAVSALLLLRLLAGWTRVRRLGRLAQPAFGPHLDRLAAIAGQSAGTPAVEFRVHRRVRTPVTIGWRRPLILLPESWIAWPVERLTAIVQHEIAHVRRRDYCWNLWAAAVEAALWFVPGLWLAARRVRLFAELAADAAASSRMGPIAYARHLVETAAGIGRRGRLAPFSLALGVTTDLQRRVDVLLDDAPRPSASAARARAAALFVAVALVWLSFACRAASAPPAHSAADHAELHALKHHH
jgi:beta-lactamase regulating signal transducer with metallopeptidase domain